MTKQFDVIIIGGGATGAGVARDCSLRGIRALLLERSDIATGATGRNHGLLHSGARYAVTDRESAEECIKENMILRRIASHCVDGTDGLFLSLPEDGLEFQSKFVDACRAAGIRAEVIDPKEALRLEPSANPALIGAVREILGSGAIFGYSFGVTDYMPLVFVLAPGAFFVLGYLMALFNKVVKKNN